MNKKINIIQFLPYYPPHKGGLESHAKEWGFWWMKKGYGNFYNVITEIPHPNPLLTGEGIDKVVGVSNACREFINKICYNGYFLIIILVLL